MNGFTTARSLLAFGLATAAIAAAPAAATAFQERPDQDPGWGGSADLGLTLTEGNSETTSISAGLNAAHTLERRRFALGLSFVRTTSDGEETANRGSAFGDLEFFPASRFFLSLRTRVGYNKPAGLDLRLSPTLSAGYVLAESDAARVSLEGGVSVVSDRFENDSTSTALYGSVGQGFQLRLNEHVDLTQSLSYQPRAENLSDYLVQGEIALTAVLVAPVGVKIRLIDEFDSTPFVDAEGNARKKNDLTLVTGLTVSF